MMTKIIQKRERSCDLLLTADVLLTRTGHWRTIDDAAVAVTDGHVTALGTRAELAAFSPRQSLNLGRSLLMPGLVNAHTHSAMTFLRGVADDLPLMEWLHKHIFPVEQRLTADIVEKAALLGCAEMIRTGTTAFTDMYLFSDAVGAAADTAGLRCLLGEGLFAFPSPAYGAAENALAFVREQAQRYRGHSRLGVAVAPHSVYTTTTHLLEGCRDLAAELGLRLHLHLAETRSETERCLAEHGLRPVEYCDRLGLLGPDTCIAHGVVLEPDELELLKKRKTRLAHCPRSNMKLASGIAPLPDMLERGMLPGLGTDGAASNNSLNMFAEMTMGALLHKAHTGDPTVCPAHAMLDMATLGGAGCMGQPLLGRLETGAPADIIALDLTAPQLLPMYNPVSHAVYAASGQEVRMTMVAGRILYKDGEFLTFDYPGLVREAEKLKQWVLAGK